MDAQPGPANEPFAWSRRDDGTVIISYRGAPVTALRGKTAARFIDRVVAADAGDAQQLMARATGRATQRDRR